MSLPPVRNWILAALAVVLLCSLALRLYGLSERGMGHAESYTPNIELPTDYGEPRSRVTLSRTISNSRWEPHPPGYYIMMWFYTKVTGTGLIAIRMPSVIFGVICVLLTFVLGRLESDSITALVGAALLGFGGHHILWSHIARPATMLVALGLLSSILLVQTMRHGSRWRAWLYVAVTVVGVTVEHYYWLLLAGQMVFCLVRYAANPAPALRVLEYQLVGVIAAAPLLTLAASQSGTAVYIGVEPSRPISDLLGLGFLFEHDPDRAPALVDTLRPYLTLAGTVLVLTGLLGFAASRPSNERETTLLPALPIWLTPALTVSSIGMVLAAAYFLATSKNMSIVPLLFTLVVPAGGFVAALIIRRYHPQLQALAARLPSRAREWFGGLSITVVMLIAPVALAATVSLIKPVLVSRHLMAFVPFLLLLTARGLVRIGSFKPRWLSVTTLAMCVAGLLGAYAVGYAYQSKAMPGPHDYRGLSQVWVPEIQPDDVILVRNHFRSTPIFYYMPPSRFNFVGLDHVAEVRRRQPRRIWVLVLGGGVPAQPAIPIAALDGYRRVGEVSAHNLRADRYERDGTASPPR